jgi:hypothetical protein
MLIRKYPAHSHSTATVIQPTIEALTVNEFVAPGTPDGTMPFD